MKARITLLAVLAALAAASCGEGGTGGDGEGLVLRYAYQPGQVLSYDVEMSAQLTMDASGAGAAANAMDTQMVMDITERIDLAFAEGPQPDTIEITMTQEVLEGGARMTVMGREQFIPLDQVAAGVDTGVVVVVDPQGRVVSGSVGGMPLPTDLFTDLSSFGVGNLAQPQFGPQFPEFGLSVGDSWETETSATVIGLDIESRGRHRVVAEEEVLGRNTYRIESTVTTKAIRADLADIIEAIREHPALMDSADAADVDAAFAQFEAMGVRLSFEVRESTVEMTTWFDPVEGIVVRLVMDSPVTMRMTMANMPQVGDVDVSIEIASTQSIQLAG